MKLLNFLLIFLIVLTLPLNAEATRRKRKSAGKKPRGCLSGSPYTAQKPAPPKVVFQFSPGEQSRFNPSLMASAKKISAIRKPVSVSSGYRSCKRNSRAGGAQKSMHLTGNAIDLSGNETLAHAIYNKNLHFGRVLWNSCRPHVHIDTGARDSFNECGGKGQFKRKKSDRNEKRKKKKQYRKKKGRR